MAWYKTAEYVSYVKNTLETDLGKALDILNNTLRKNSAFHDSVIHMLNLYSTNRRAYSLDLTIDQTTQSKLVPLVIELLEKITIEKDEFIYLRMYEIIVNNLREYSSEEVKVFRDRKKRRAKGKNNKSPTKKYLLYTGLILFIGLVLYSGNDFKKNSEPAQALLSDGPGGDSQEKVHRWAVKLRVYSDLHKAKRIKENHTVYRTIDIVRINDSEYMAVIFKASKEEAEKERRKGSIKKHWRDAKVIPIQCQLGNYDSDDFLTCR